MIRVAFIAKDRFYGFEYLSKLEQFTSKEKLKEFMKELCCNNCFLDKLGSRKNEASCQEMVDVWNEYCKSPREPINDAILLHMDMKVRNLGRIVFLKNRHLENLAMRVSNFELHSTTDHPDLD